MEVSAYADYLTEADLRLIARAVGTSAATVAELAGDAAAIEGLLADPRVFSAVFGTPSPAAPGAAEVLASFTRVASGRYRVPSRWGASGPGSGAGSGAGPGGRSRTRRFSELDPVKL